MNKQFGGLAVFVDRSDINTDEIIPAKYLTEISKQALKPHLLENLELKGFDPQSEEMQRAKVLVTRSNFGCGSSREHAVWALEANDINVVIAESFARIFRQNCFNCGILATELSVDAIDDIFRSSETEDQLMVEIDFEEEIVVTKRLNGRYALITTKFQLNDFDRNLIETGGWLAYADQRY